MMENMNDKPQGLVARISTLLNNEVCSDVVIQVRHNEQKKFFYAHSPVLFVAGKRFTDLTKQTSQAKVIKISDFSPYIVEMMLTYIYTDELNLLSMENAVDLYKLSRMYGIDDLEKLCSNYITKEEVNIDNLFVKYESALSCNFPKLLEKCRHLVQSETKAVFASRYFGEAPFSVVEDIFSLDNLNVSSEFDVINAAFRWSACECRRKGRPTEKLCLRDAVDPLLKHLRFLCISADDFCDYTAKDDNIFTSFESTVLTRKILQPDHNGVFPKYLCPISKPRQPFLKTSHHMASRINSVDFNSGSTNNNTLKDTYLKRVDENTLKDTYSEPLNRNNFKDRYSESGDKHAFKDPYVESDKKNAVRSTNSVPAHRNNFFDRYSEPVHRNTFNDSAIDPFSKVNFGDYLPESASRNKSSSNSPEPVHDLKSSQDDTLFFRQSLDKTPPPFSRAEQKPLFQYNQKKSTPLLRVMPQAMPAKQIFEFPLQEIRKGIEFASFKDIKCNATIQMLDGVIFVNGIELKILEQKHKLNESIEVLSCITNNNPSKYDTYSLKLMNSILSITYPEPLKVSPGNPLDIEITIEDLVLNRCFVCLGHTQELNCGLKAKAKISVKSNQSDGQDNALYLINRIFYTISS